MNTMMNFFDRNFKIWGYTVSHNFLLLRSPMMFADVEGYSDFLNFNIDIEFISVLYIDIPSTMKGISIREIKENIPPKLQRYKDDPVNKILEIKSNNISYYIVAGNLLIGTNRWMNESRMSNLESTYDEILMAL